MTTINTLFKLRSVYTGVFAVVGTVLLGGAIAVGAGLVTPAGAFADETSPTTEGTQIETQTTAAAPSCSLRTGSGSALALLDYTADGVLDTEDSQYLLEIAVGLHSCPSGTICDINNSGSVTASDAQMYAQYVNNVDLTGTHTLVWDTNNASAFKLDTSIGFVIPVGTGVTKVSPTVTTTYTGTATGPGGSTTCSVTIPVTPPPAEAPTCTLMASPPGTINTTPLDYNNDHVLNTADVQFLLEVAVGSRSCPSKTVSPSETTTFTGTVTGNGLVRHCSVTVTVTPPQVLGCTLTQGYWKTHNNSFNGGANADSTWDKLGASKELTPFFTSGKTWYGVFWTEPAGNVYYQLAHQYMAAKLNLLKGAQMPAHVQTAFDTATTLLSGTTPVQVDALGDSSKATWTNLAGVLGSYNEGNEGVPHCNVPPPPVAPTCSLSAQPASIVQGSAATIAWTASNTSTLSIDRGVGIVTPAAAGSTSVSPTETTTYTATATGAGGIAHCSTTITVTTGGGGGGGPTAPACTLAASPNPIAPGESTTLSWTAARATTFSIDQGIGAVTPVSAGSTSVSPAVTTTYTGTVVGGGGTRDCTVTVTVSTVPPAPTCSLSAQPASVESGARASLTWTTTNAATFNIEGIGAVSPVSGGSTTTSAITGNTTFTGTATSPTGQTATCSAPVTVIIHEGSPSCSLTISPSSYVTGGSATLSWSGSRISTVDIDHGIATATTSSGSIQISPTELGTHTYTGQFRATNGQTLTCNATLEVTGAGCTSDCGGGGGGGGGRRSSSRANPNVLLSATPHAGIVAGASIYLSQIPYTGLDLGPLGTVVYWLGLIAWSLALAYLVLFGAVPSGRRYAHTFGERVALALNAREFAPANTSQVQPIVQAVSHAAQEPQKAPKDAPRGYSSFDGFKSFAQNEVLSIEDIVKGLARAHKIPVETPAPITEPIYKNVEPIYDAVEPIQEMVTPNMNEYVAQSTGIPTDVRGFTSALIQGDREAVFAGLRQHTRGGGSSESLITPAVCLLDDAYRARVDGTACDPDIARLTARITTPVLEKLIASLTNAIDSSYSVGVTGAKLALTRALSILGA